MSEGKKTRFKMPLWLQWMPRIHIYLEIWEFSIATRMFYESYERMSYDVFLFRFRAFRWNGDFELVYPHNLR